MLWRVMEQHTQRNTHRDRVGGWVRELFQVKITIVAISCNGFYVCGRGNKMGTMDTQMGHKLTHTFTRIYTKSYMYKMHMARFTRK